MNSRALRLLACLRKNSREKLTNISKETGIPISTLFDLLREVQQSVISKNTVLLDFASMGFHSHAYVFLKVSAENKNKVRKYLRLNNSVNTIYKINNGWDFVIETVHKNIRDLDKFIDYMESEYGVRDRKIHYLVDELKKEEFHSSFV